MSASRHRRWLVPLGLIVLAFAIFFAGSVVEICRDWAFVCEYTGSRQGYREWLFGVRTGAWYRESALEAFLRAEYPGELDHKWTSYMGTGRGLLVKSFGHGHPGPILQLSLETLASYDRIATKLEK